MTSPAQLEQHHTYHFNENYATDITEAEDLLVRAAASQSRIRILLLVNVKIPMSFSVAAADRGSSDPLWFVGD